MFSSSVELFKNNILISTLSSKICDTALPRNNEQTLAYNSNSLRIFPVKYLEFTRGKRYIIISTMDE